MAFYVDMFNREFKKNVRGISPAALALLRSYGWPGNVRELRNVVERAMLLAAGDTLEPEDFPIAVGATASATSMELPADGHRARERRAGPRACRPSSARAGTRPARRKLLGLNRDQIHYRIEKFKLAGAVETRRSEARRVVGTGRRWRGSRDIVQLRRPCAVAARSARARSSTPTIASAAGVSTRSRLPDRHRHRRARRSRPPSITGVVPTPNASMTRRAVRGTARRGSGESRRVHQTARRARR